MNELLKKTEKLIKSPKAMVVLGIVGIALIFLSSFFGSDSKDVSQQTASSAYLEEYRLELERQVKELVISISGDKAATVVLTLESGIRYSYADAVSTDSSASTAEKGEQSSKKQTNSFVTVKTPDGGEQALLITEGCPKIRGVAIVCSGGADAETAEKIENAVMAALDITAKRVYIAGGNFNEKR